MQSVKQSFEELRHRLKQRHTLTHISDDPVFYLVFRPKEMLDVKRLLKQWEAKLNLDGWVAHFFSMADAIKEIFSDSSLRDLWLASEEEAPLDFDEVNKTLADALIANDTLKNKLDQKLQSLSGQQNALLFVTDLEALHPYLRVGSLEQKLQGRFTVPTVILYPGRRAGKTTLSFLGIYPEDGNYRSVHIGG
jgi:hypothetical protein